MQPLLSLSPSACAPWDQWCGEGHGRVDQSSRTVHQATAWASAWVEGGSTLRLASTGGRYRRHSLCPNPLALVMDVARNAISNAVYMLLVRLLSWFVTMCDQWNPGFFLGQKGLNVTPK